MPFCKKIFLLIIIVSLASCYIIPNHKVKPPQADPCDPDTNLELCSGGESAYSPYFKDINIGLEGFSKDPSSVMHNRTSVNHKKTRLKNRSFNNTLSQKRSLNTFIDPVSKIRDSLTQPRKNLIQPSPINDPPRNVGVDQTNVKMLRITYVTPNNTVFNTYKSRVRIRVFLERNGSKMFFPDIYLAPSDKQEDAFIDMTLTDFQHNDILGAQLYRTINSETKYYTQKKTLTLIMDGTNLCDPEVGEICDDNTDYETFKYIDLQFSTTNKEGQQRDSKRKTKFSIQKYTNIFTNGIPYANGLLFSADLGSKEDKTVVVNPQETNSLEFKYLLPSNSPAFDGEKKDSPIKIRIFQKNPQGTSVPVNKELLVLNKLGDVAEFLNGKFQDKDIYFAQLYREIDGDILVYTSPLNTIINIKDEAICDPSAGNFCEENTTYDPYFNNINLKLSSSDTAFKKRLSKKIRSVGISSLNKRYNIKNSGIRAEMALIDEDVNTDITHEWFILAATNKSLQFEYYTPNNSPLFDDFKKDSEVLVRIFADRSGEGKPVPINKDLLSLTQVSPSDMIRSQDYKDGDIFYAQFYRVLSIPGEVAEKVYVYTQKLKNKITLDNDPVCEPGDPECPPIDPTDPAMKYFKPIDLTVTLKAPSLFSANISQKVRSLTMQKFSIKRDFSRKGVLRAARLWTSQDINVNKSDSIIIVPKTEVTFSYHDTDGTLFDEQDSPIHIQLIATRNSNTIALGTLTDMTEGNNAVMVIPQALNIADVKGYYNGDVITAKLYRKLDIPGNAPGKIYAYAQPLKTIINIDDSSCEPGDPECPPIDPTDPAMKYFKPIKLTVTPINTFSASYKVRTLNMPDINKPQNFSIKAVKAVINTFFNNQDIDITDESHVELVKGIPLKFTYTAGSEVFEDSTQEKLIQIQLLTTRNSKPIALGTLTKMTDTSPISITIPEGTSGYQTGDIITAKLYRKLNIEGEAPGKVYNYQQQAKTIIEKIDDYCDPNTDPSCEGPGTDYKPYFYDMAVEVTAIGASFANGIPASLIKTNGKLLKEDISTGPQTITINKAETKSLQIGFDSPQGELFKTYKSDVRVKVYLTRDGSKKPKPVGDVTLTQSSPVKDFSLTDFKNDDLLTTQVYREINGITRFYNAKTTIKINEKSSPEDYFKEIDLDYGSSTSDIIGSTTIQGTPLTVDLKAKKELVLIYKPKPPLFDIHKTSVNMELIRVRGATPFTCNNSAKLTGYTNHTYSVSKDCGPLKNGDTYYVNFSRDIDQSETQKFTQTSKITVKMEINPFDPYFKDIEFSYGEFGDGIVPNPKFTSINGEPVTLDVGFKTDVLVTWTSKSPLFNGDLKDIPVSFQVYRERNGNKTECDKTWQKDFEYNEQFMSINAKDDCGGLPETGDKYYAEFQREVDGEKYTFKQKSILTIGKVAENIYDPFKNIEFSVGYKAEACNFGGDVYGHIGPIDISSSPVGNDKPIQQNTEFGIHCLDLGYQPVGLFNNIKSDVKISFKLKRNGGTYDLYGYTRESSNGAGGGHQDNFLTLFEKDPSTAKHIEIKIPITKTNSGKKNTKDDKIYEVQDGDQIWGIAERDYNGIKTYSQEAIYTFRFNK